MDNDNKDIVISVKNVSKRYKLYKTKTDRMKEALSVTKKSFHQDFYALHNVDLEIKKGEILGIVGRNGSGKSTLLKIISGILQPTEGEVKTKGKIIPLLELGNGFNPEFTGLENIYFYNSVLGFSRKETDERLQDILDFAEIGEFIHQPLKTYSSGMKARLAFAVSVNIDPDILIVDEVLAVGDELFRRKSYAKMQDLFKSGKTVIFVSHSAQAISTLCKETILIEEGRILYYGSPKETISLYQKLLYSNKNNKEKILIEVKVASDFKNQTKKNIEETAVTKNQRQHSNKYFIENFKPKSTVVRKNFDIEVYKTFIYDNEQSPVNILIHNHEYIIEFFTHFKFDVPSASFAMAIKHEKGFTITNAGGINHKNTCPINAKKDETYRIRWRFRNILTPGNYFINIQVSGRINDIPQELIDINDVLVFKVEPIQKISFGGIVSMDQKISVEVQ